MSYGIIDVGSNSVRLLFDGEKQVINTRLAEKSSVGDSLLPEAMTRTAEAVFSLADYALSRGGKVKAFATEAVRSANNGNLFVEMLRKRGIECEVLSSEKEARIGFVGAYYGTGQKAVLDVGGASSELIVGSETNILYSHSLPLGSVRVSDMGLEVPLLNKKVAQRVKEYGVVPAFKELIGIGGTSSSILAVRDEVEPYDPNKIHLHTLTLDDIERVTSYIYSTPPERRKEIKGLHPKKIFSVPAGGVLIAEIMRYLNINVMTVSERDNLEGYLCSLPRC